MASVPETPVLREERKVVTALFADLVGSTAIGERFDPEDAREIISEALARMIEAIERYGGTVKDLAGDGVLALFGAPASHEDDVERAILAGLEMAEAIPVYAQTVARRWGHEGLGVRVGIETGLAVLGPVGAGGRIEYGAVGDVVNTAARLQAAAPLGVVLVGDVARNEVANRFGWGPPSGYTLKGKDDPVVAAVAIDPRGTDRRPVRVDAPFVGRAAELASMDEALGALAGGRGSVLVMTGEPGIGKSRSVAEARRRALAGRYGRPITWLEGGCVSWADGIPFGMYRDVLARWLGIRHDDPVDRVVAALADLAGSIPALEAVDIDLLGRIFEASQAAPDDDPESAEANREKVFDAVVATFSGLATSSPLVVSLEDVHWADPTSLALTERLIGSAVDTPLLVLLTRRPSGEYPSTGALDAAVERLGAAATSLVLPPLADQEHRRLLDSMIGGAVPDDVRQTILETTEGNPFFLEEQIRSLEESGRLVPDRDGRPRFVGNRPFEMPRTVERVLLARIDRLTAADKDVLVAASVLGREFDLTLLERLTGDGADVRATLDHLGAIDLVRSEGHADRVRFRFKHALIQEAAYGTLLKRQRRALHRGAADAIGSVYEGRLDQVAGVLGRHLHEAGEPELAVPHLLTAGDRAREAFANDEALSWYSRASDAVREIPDRAEGDAWAEAEADLNVRRGGIFDLTGRFEEARHAYRHALDAAPPGDRVKVARIRTRSADVEITDHRYENALAELDRAEDALAASRTKPPEDPQAMEAWLDIQDSRMGVYYWVGDVEAYTELIDGVRPIVESRGTPAQRVAFFDSILTYRMRLERYVLSEETVDVARTTLDAAEKLGDDVRTAWSRFELGFALVWAGRPDDATAELRATKLEADRMGDVTLRSRSLMYLLVADRQRGDPVSVERAIDPVIEAARDASLPEYEAMAIANRSWVHAREGRDADCEADARTAIELLRSLPIHYPFEWMALWPLLGVELRRGGIADAIACARDMLDEDQQPLPPDLRAKLENAVETWDDGRTEVAADELGSALHLARRRAFA